MTFLPSPLWRLGNALAWEIAPELLSRVPGTVYVYRRHHHPYGPALLALRGGLLSCTYLGRHGVVTQYHDVQSVTHQFRRHLNTRWFVHGVVASIVLVIGAAPLVEFLPEFWSKIAAAVFVVPALLLALITILAVFLPRRTVRLHCSSQDKRRWIEFNYRPDQDPVLNEIVHHTEPYRGTQNAPPPRRTVRHTRDWRGAFPVRFTMLWFYEVYDAMKYLAPILALPLLLVHLIFDLSAIAMPLAIIMTATPGLCVAGYVVWSLWRNEGPWSDRAQRRQVLRMARRESLSAIYEHLAGILVSRPNDTEYLQLFAQLLNLQGHYDSARRCILRCGALHEHEVLRWEVEIDYLEHLDGWRGTREDVGERNWAQELEALDDV